MGENYNIVKASKGTVQYQEWLRKYLEKRLGKQQNHANEENKRHIENYDRTVKLADSIINKSIASAGEPARSILDVFDRLGFADGEGKSRVDAVKEQVLALTQECQDLNFDYSSLEQNYTRKQQFEGAESKLFMPESLDFIIKVQDFSVQSRTPEDYIINRIIIHNSIFRNCQYQLHGYTFDNSDGVDRIKFIVSQPLIKGRAATEDEINNFMTGLGFKRDRLNKDWFTLGNLRVTDLNTHNVLVDDNGQVYVIDDVIDILKE